MSRLDSLKEDLRWQLTFEHMDWDYFLNTAREARELEEEERADDEET